MPAENGDSLALGLTRAADSEKFHLWEKGLPSADELVPLNQSLITPVLAHAFSIKETIPSQAHRDHIEMEHPAHAAVRSLLQSACAPRERGAQELQLLPMLPRRETNGSSAPTDDVAPATSNGAAPSFLQSQKKAGEFLESTKQGPPQPELTPKQQKPAGGDEEEEAGLSLRKTGSSKKGTGEEGRALESRPNASSEKAAGKPSRPVASNGKAEGEAEEREAKKRRREPEDQGKRAEREAASPDDEDGFVPGGRPHRNDGAWGAMDNASGDEEGGKEKPKAADGGAKGEGVRAKRGRDADEDSDSVERLQKEEGGDVEGREDEQEEELGKTSAEKKRSKKPKSAEDDGNEDSGGDNNSSDDLNPRTLKRPRLVWTPQLHKRFVDAVSHLGIKNAVPKTIMQLMNVEGLTRENVASHLQKYRLYLKRMQGVSPDAPSASDHHLFGSAPMPSSISSPPQQRMAPSGPGASAMSAGMPGMGAPGSLVQRDPTAGAAAVTAPGGPQLPLGLGAAGFLGSGMPAGADPNAAGMAAAAAAAAALGGQKPLLLNDQLAQSLAVGADPLGRTLNAYAAAAAAAYDMQRQQLPFLPPNINPLLMAGGALPAWANLAAGTLPAGNIAGASLPGAAGITAPAGLAAAALGASNFTQGAGTAASAPRTLAAASGLMGSGGFASGGALLGGTRGLAGMAGLTSAGALSLGGLAVDPAAASAALTATAAALGNQAQLGRGAQGPFGGLERKDGSREQLTLAMAQPESPRPHSPPKRALNLFPE